MAVEFNGGVVIGADSRTTTGYADMLSLFTLLFYVLLEYRDLFGPMCNGRRANKHFVILKH